MENKIKKYGIGLEVLWVVQSCKVSHITFNEVVDVCVTPDSVFGSSPSDEFKVVLNFIFILLLFWLFFYIDLNLNTFNIE